jgi:hypothetical protein
MVGISSTTRIRIEVENTKPPIHTLLDDEFETVKTIYDGSGPWASLLRSPVSLFIISLLYAYRLLPEFNTHPISVLDSRCGFDVQGTSF